MWFTFEARLHRLFLGQTSHSTTEENECERRSFLECPPSEGLSWQMQKGDLSMELFRVHQEQSR